MFSIDNSKIDLLVQWALEESNNVFIKHPDVVQKKLQQLDKDTVDHLHIITDFDMTLTKYWSNGKRSTSSHGVLEGSRKMKESSGKESLTLLYQHYYPIEISATIPYKDKFKAMEEWWMKAHEIIVNTKLTHSDIKQMVNEMPVTFRPKLAEFLALALKRNIPTLVFSAGLADVIEEILSRANLLLDNMFIVSNRMRFDASDVVVGFIEPLIHTFNKNEAVITDTPHHPKIENRRNVLLMGDSLGDLRMGDKVDCDVKLTVGFLNHDKELLLDQYAEAFDILILEDSPMDFVIMLLSSLA